MASADILGQEAGAGGEEVLIAYCLLMGDGSLSSPLIPSEGFDEPHYSLERVEL